MTKTTLAAAATLLIALMTAPASAQTASPGPEAKPPAAADKARPARKSRKKDGASKRELTVNQMAASEQRKKCGAEWKEAKAAGKVADGLRWPKFYSQCNARLKGNSA
jgi:uncharacterized protein with LGFP repeats